MWWSDFHPIFNIVRRHGWIAKTERMWCSLLRPRKAQNWLKINVFKAEQDAAITAKWRDFRAIFRILLDLSAYLPNYLKEWRGFFAIHPWRRTIPTEMHKGGVRAGVERTNSQTRKRKRVNSLFVIFGIGDRRATPPGGRRASARARARALSTQDFFFVF